MATPTFDTILNQAYLHYLNGDYAQAYDLISTTAEHYPHKAAMTYYWRACLAAVQGQTALALQLLAAALEAGYWYSEPHLRDEQDLQSLQGLPEFEQLVNISLDREAQARAQSKPDLLTVPPEGVAPPYPLMIALHGNANNGRDSLSYWRPLVDKGWLLALPQSSQVVGIDMFIWNDREKAMHELEAHDRALKNQYEIDRARTLIGGFSLGAETAIHLALTGTVRVQGFIAVAPGGPYTRQPENWAPLIQACEGRRLRGYIILGEKDNLAVEGTMPLVEMLRAYGIPCEVEHHTNLGHAFPPDFERSLEKALAFLLQS